MNYIDDSKLTKIVKESIHKVLNDNTPTITEERKRIKEEFRKHHQKAMTANEDVMKRFYGITSNNYKPVRIDEITLDRVLKKHGKNGMINISANKSGEPQKLNDEQTRSLIKDLKQSGYLFLPTYGRHKGYDGLDYEYEPSFIVFNYDKNGNSKNFEQLRQFALALCGKYNQDSVIVTAPEKSAIWVDIDGNEVSKTENGFDECCVNPMPCQLSERMRRKNEVMFWE